MDQDKVIKIAEYFSKIYKGEDKGYLLSDNLEMYGVFDGIATVFYLELQKVVSKEFIMFMLLIGYSIKDFTMKYDLNKSLED